MEFCTSPYPFTIMELCLHFMRKCTEVCFVEASSSADGSAKHSSASLSGDPHGTPPPPYLLSSISTSLVVETL